MKLLTWNINRGGGKRIDQIAISIKNHEPDIVVLTEYRNNKAGLELRSRLDSFDLVHQVSIDTPITIDSVLVSSNIQYKYMDHSFNEFSLLTRLICLDFKRFILVAVYLNPFAPGRKFYEKRKKFQLFWEGVIKLGKEYINRPSIFIGDFNTGKDNIDAEGTAFPGYEHIDKMKKLGFKDAWRHLNPNKREYTWFSPKRRNGFRLDYIFLSSKIQNRLVEAYHSHVEREMRISDHSLLIATLKDL
jgi:exodeoxyribonuclease-3